jgi:hypothetical protein
MKELEGYRSRTPRVNDFRRKVAATMPTPTQLRLNHHGEVMPIEQLLNCIEQLISWWKKMLEQTMMVHQKH